MIRPKTIAVPPQRVSFRIPCYKNNSGAYISNFSDSLRANLSLQTPAVDAVELEELDEVEDVEPPEELDPDEHAGCTCAARDFEVDSVDDVLRLLAVLKCLVVVGFGVLGDMAVDGGAVDAVDSQRSPLTSQGSWIG